MQINRQSYEEFFLLYADGELNESGKKAVEEFIDQNPDLAGELTLIQETVMKPDGSIIFENKELLFKDESNERKVIYMRWFRIAAAAAVLIAFGVVGWEFFGKSNIHNEPVAIVKPPESKNIEPSNVVSRNEASIKSAQPVVRPGKKKIISNQHSSNQKKNIEAGNKNVINERDVADVVPLAKDVEGAAFTQDVVKSEPDRKTIDIAVEPRAMERNDDQPANNASYAQSFPQEPDNDMIYFANTSLTKKTKLRGVLRKATRYLDRVTSLQ